MASWENCRRRPSLSVAANAISYVITVANNGQSPATGVVLTDQVPEHAMLVAGSVTTSQGVVASEQPVAVDLGAIAPGSAATVSFRVVLQPLPLGTVKIANQATISSAELVDVLSDDPDLGGAADPTLTPVAGDPELQATKTDVLAEDRCWRRSFRSARRRRGWPGRRRRGSGAASGVVLRDLIAAHTSVVSDSVATSAGTVLGEDPVEVDFGEVAAGASISVSFEVEIVNPIPAGTVRIVNQGTLTSDQLPAVLTDDPDLGGDADPTETTITAAPDLVAEKTDALFGDADGNGVPSPGDVIEYALRIFNNGNTSATAVVLDDAVPEHTEVVAGSVITDRGSVDSENPVTVTIGEIAGGMDLVIVSFRVVVESPIAAAVMDVVNQGVVHSAELADVLT